MDENKQIIAIPSFLTETFVQDNSIAPLCEGCMTTCEIYCETGCEVCLNCESACETSSCQSGCQTNCESLCEKNCQTGCQVSCQTGCQVNCQSSCQLACQTCQSSCQSSGNHKYTYTDWQPNGASGCKRLKLCSNSGCTTNIVETKAHRLSSVGSSSVCMKCSDCGWEDTSHSMWITDKYTLVDETNHMTYRKCSKCGYTEAWTTETHNLVFLTATPANENYHNSVYECTKCHYLPSKLETHKFNQYGECTICGYGRKPFPLDFDWDESKIKGQKFALGSGEYNRFMRFLNQKLDYFNKSTVSKSTVYSGEIVYAITVNDALDGLRRLGCSGVPSDAVKDQKIEAQLVNTMRDCLNSIKKPN